MPFILYYFICIKCGYPSKAFSSKKKIQQPFFYSRKTKSWSISRFLQLFLDLSGQILENNTHIHIINLSIECVMHMYKYTYAIQLNLLFYSNKISFKFFFVFFCRFTILIFFVIGFNLNYLCFFLLPS